MHRFITKAAAATRTLIAICGILVFAQHAQATIITQSTAPASADSWSGWSWQPLGSITLAKDTNSILGLTSTVTLVDQGWGGQDPTSNQVLVSLFNNSTDLFNIHVAGAYHYTTTQAFNIATQIDVLSGLNAALSTIDWSINPTVTLRMNIAPLGYPGWALHASNASFSATSTVPEPSTIALFGIALAMAAFASRARKNV